MKTRRYRSADRSASNGLGRPFARACRAVNSQSSLSPFVPCDLPDLPQRTVRARASVAAWSARRDELASDAAANLSWARAFEFVALEGRLRRVRTACREWNGTACEPIADKRRQQLLLRLIHARFNFSATRWLRRAARLSRWPFARGDLLSSPGSAAELLTQLDDLDLVCVQIEDHLGSGKSYAHLGATRASIDWCTNWLLDHAGHFRRALESSLTITLSADPDVLNRPGWAETMEKHLAVIDTAMS